MNYAQPGFGSGDPYHSLSPADLIQAATNDGLEPVANPGGSAYPSVPEGKTLVAQITGLAVKIPDYHWYRRDRDGKWTHKPGPGAATDMNWNYTATISDPRIKANWDPMLYDTFVGFYLVDSNYFEGQGWENVNGDSRRYGPGLDEAGAGAGVTALSADAGALTATVRIFSGRKNPEARLADPAVVQKVALLVRQTTALSTAAVPPSVPLYKGIAVDNPDGLGGMPKTFTIYANLIVAPGVGAANATYRQDSSGTLESYLLDQMVGVGGLDSSLRDSIRTLAGK
jgi:hypothetical protein